MKTIGLIGGMSWESSIEYYRIMNERVRDRLGGLHSASCILYSFDFEEIATLQRAGRWDDATSRLVEAAQAVERGGAGVVLICTNTMHRMYAAVQDAVRIPVIHIADPTAERIKAAGLRTVGLLATKFTMEESFYKGRLTEQHGLDVLVPPAEQRELVHNVIFGELCRGKIREESRKAFAGIMRDLAEGGAEAVILGCTEIGLLVRPSDCPVPIFDTTILHAEAAVDFAMNGHAAGLTAAGA